MVKKLIGEFGAAARDADPDAEPDQFSFFGETFTVATRVGAMPLIKFGKVAEGDVEAHEMAGLAAMYDLLADCLAPGDWVRFQQVATTNKASAEELMEVCGAVYQTVTARPTSQPSASVDGSPSTTGSSKEPSSSGVSSRPNWRDTPFGRRELTAVPELYEGIGSLADHGRAMLETG